MEVERNMDMFIDLLIMVQDNTPLDDPDLNPNAVELYQKLFGDGD